MADEFEYEEVEEDNRDFESSLNRILHGNKNSIHVMYPCKIISVNSQHSVNIEYYKNGEADILYNVPVKHKQTSSAFFIIKLKKGDKGVVSFFDDDIELYRTSGTIAESSEVKTHDLNDNLFEVGFYPDNENYEFPDGDLVIGTTAGAVISLTEQTINISASNSNITIPNNSVTGNIEITGNVKITGNLEVTGTSTLTGACTFEGKEWLSHTHLSTVPDSPTGGVN